MSVESPTSLLLSGYPKGHHTAQHYCQEICFRVSNGTRQLFWLRRDATELAINEMVSFLSATLTGV
jgi:hypothetical protein